MQRRVQELQKKMREQGFGAAVLMNRVDVFYYSGTGQACNLLVPSEGKPLLLARRSFELIKRDTWIQDVLEGGSVSHIRELLSSIGLNRGVVGVQEDVIPAQLYNKMAEGLRGYQLRNVSPLVLRQRAVKDPEEIAILKKARSLFGEVHKAFLEHLRPGVTELELAAHVVYRLRRSEHEGTSSYRRWDALAHPEGFLVSGDNLWLISRPAITVTGIGTSKVMPWGASHRVIREGDLVVMDLGLNYQGYHADTTRTYVAGKANARQKQVFADLLQVHRAVLAEIRPGVPINRLYRVARAKAEELGYSDYFQGYGRERGPYIGHSIGLELDEWPTLGPDEGELLQENMTLSIEPKFIIPGFGAVAVEDNLVVTADGYEPLGELADRLYEILQVS